MEFYCTYQFVVYEIDLTSAWNLWGFNAKCNTNKTWILSCRKIEIYKKYIYKFQNWMIKYENILNLIYYNKIIISFVTILLLFLLNTKF